MSITQRKGCKVYLTPVINIIFQFLRKKTVKNGLNIGHMP